MDGFLNQKLKWNYEVGKYFIKNEDLKEFLSDVKYLITDFIKKQDYTITDLLFTLEEIIECFDVDYDVTDARHSPENLLDKIIEPQMRIVDCFSDLGYDSLLQYENDLCIIIQYCCAQVHQVYNKITKPTYFEPLKKIMNDLLYYVD